MIQGTTISAVNAALGQHASNTKALQKHTSHVPALANRTLRSPRLAPMTVCYGFSVLSEGPSMVNIVGQFTSAAAWITAAYFAYQLVLQQDATARPGQKECERCNGTGYVECFCTRWSDASSDKTGCSSCRGSRKMQCSSCGGGGTTSPIVDKLYIRPEKDYYK
jgi:hypothetical protein